jgi:hypothetical protein
MLDDQSALRKKERDKSALARNGIEYCSFVEYEEYDSIKAAAEMQGNPLQTYL